MTKVSRIAIGIITTVAVLCVGVFWFVREPAIDPLDSDRTINFESSLIQRGANLAALGDCNTCHTAPRGRVFAGGFPLPTPFGTIYSTNITPDPETGIGRWSEAAFQRAMRQGVSRDGRHLYPAFPYDHFTLVSDEDNKALYAFLMTRQPVRVPARVNRLPFPLNMRPVLAGWKLLFLREGPFRPDPAHDSAWNRGAYLVQGIGHCGACHTPRNILGAEKPGKFFTGGEAEGWQALAINADSHSPIPWNAVSLKAYLHQGWDVLHGVARGPMAPVADNLASVSDDDVTAIAVYVASVMGEPSKVRRQQGEGLIRAAKSFGTGRQSQSGGSQGVPTPSIDTPGAMIYAAACASCHESGRSVPYGGIDLSLSPLLSTESPRNFLNVVLAGLVAADGRRGPIMPGFAATLTDQQVVALAGYMRSQFSTKPVWSDITGQLSEVRSGLTVFEFSSDAGLMPIATGNQGNP